MTSAANILLHLLPGLGCPLVLQAQSLPSTDHCSPHVVNAAVRHLDQAGIIPKSDIESTRNAPSRLAHEMLPHEQFREVYRIRLKSHGGEHLTLILDRQVVAQDCQQESLRHLHLILRSFQAGDSLPQASHPRTSRPSSGITR